MQSLIHWIGAHTHYSENIPPLPAGADTVDEFLFGNRVGFCEQISTSLAVMLRSLGIPAREAVGYVPGGFNPITDLYQVHANDAHAWVQVWFPGYGWQDFDPTAVVPLSPPSPGATALHDVGVGSAAVIPPVPAAAVVVSPVWSSSSCAGAESRPATWAERVARRAERAGRRAGRPRRPSETLAEYAGRLDGLLGRRGVDLEPVGLGGGGERLRGARPAPGRSAPWSRRPGGSGRPVPPARPTLPPPYPPPLRRRGGVGTRD